MSSYKTDLDHNSIKKGEEPDLVSHEQEDAVLGVTLYRLDEVQRPGHLFELQLYITRAFKVLALLLRDVSWNCERSNWSKVRHSVLTAAVLCA